MEGENLLNKKGRIDYILWNIVNGVLEMEDIFHPKLFNFGVGESDLVDGVAKTISVRGSELLDEPVSIGNGSHKVSSLL